MSRLHTFIAKYDGWCAICHKHIDAGSTVAYDEDKNLVHASCAEDDE